MIPRLDHSLLPIIKASRGNLCSTSRCKKLFPTIDEWHDRLAAKELSPDNNNPIQPTVAANAFVQVIMMLRKTFIQELGAHDGTPPLPSHLTTFNLL
ncbi:hypothetical protein [Absidia glauca]|uniref:Ndc10 domain-containing protein n=1 Tax=Absidia glauca TaxID=4829 RepID=A0A163JQB3_ABSGL|nr:hypothetical protein [Absidia glauca]